MSLLYPNYYCTTFYFYYYRVDGGVANNDFIVQLMADLTNQPIDRSKQTESMSSLGTAFFAGLAVGKSLLP